MTIKSQVGQIDRRKFAMAHNDTVYVQPCFPRLKEKDLRLDTFAYMPCWAIIDPGMKVEPHKHPIPEFYVFTCGKGTMQLGRQTFPVKAGMAVNIPQNMMHSVTNDKNSLEPMVWVSIGLRGEGKPPKLHE